MTNPSPPLDDETDPLAEHWLEGLAYVTAVTVAAVCVFWVLAATGVVGP